jgi:hypothetical protein
MSFLAKLHHALQPWIVFSPVLILGAAVIATQLIKRGKWLVHTSAVAAMVLSGPVYLHIQDVLDPSSIEHPGPGDGLGVLMWLFCLALALILYAAYSLFYAAYVLLARRKRRHQLGSFA